MDLDQIRAALLKPIQTDPPWMPSTGWRSTLILSEYEIEVILDRIRSLGEQQ